MRRLACALWDSSGRVVENQIRVLVTNVSEAKVLCVNTSEYGKPSKLQLPSGVIAQGDSFAAGVDWILKQDLGLSHGVIRNYIGYHEHEKIRDWYFHVGLVDGALQTASYPYQWLWPYDLSELESLESVRMANLATKMGYDIDKFYKLEDMIYSNHSGYRLNVVIRNAPDRVLLTRVNKHYGLSGIEMRPGLSMIEKLDELVKGQFGCELQKIKGIANMVHDMALGICQVALEVHIIGNPLGSNEIWASRFAISEGRYPLVEDQVSLISGCVYEKKPVVRKEKKLLDGVVKELNDHGSHELVRESTTWL